LLIERRAEYELYFQWGWGCDLGGWPKGRSVQLCHYRGVWPRGGYDREGFSPPTLATTGRKSAICARSLPAAGSPEARFTKNPKCYLGAT